MICSATAGRFRAQTALALVFVAGLACASAGAQTIGPVFVIPMENHNWTQPSTYTSTKQILGNPAAPFINSLVTPGNPNAQYVSYASNYQNAASGDHPSEPNYIWSEAGTNFGVASDNDPTTGTTSSNTFNTPHLTRLLSAAGVIWNNYQEDYQISGLGPTHSASGTYAAGATNLYNGSTQYSYAVKHNPMAFFIDTQTQNVYPISKLATDLANNTVGQYNWITPDLYNDMHTALSAGYTYQGTHYTGDQAAVAQGDNFLSVVVPLIEASAAFQQQNGTIILWNDETEGGDTSNFTIMEIVISKLAKGNAYTNTIRYTHSSDLKTMQELFSVPNSASASGFLNDAANATDFADLFVPGSLPNAGAASLSVNRACCLAPGGCSVLTPAGCSAAGGTQGPFNSACSTYCCGALSFTAPPQAAFTCPSGAPGFSASATGGSGPLAYSWQVQTAPSSWTTLSSSPTSVPCSAAGGVGSGMASASAYASDSTPITITGCLGVQHWQIQAVVTDNAACGSLASNPATLLICPADFNCSGSVTVQDIFDFLSAWFAARPSADFNGSGSVTVQDIFDYLSAWFAGCA